MRKKTIGIKRHKKQHAECSFAEMNKKVALTLQFPFSSTWPEDVIYCFFPFYPSPSFFVQRCSQIHINPQSNTCTRSPQTTEFLP